VRKRYFDALFRASCVDSAVPVHLVLVLCSDFYSNCLLRENTDKTFDAF
jgi:hypothetical protein